MAEYSESFARFIIECKETYEDLCRRIENGEVPSGTSAKVTIEIPVVTINQIRAERVIALAETNGGGSC